MKIAIIEPVGGHGGMNYYDFSLAEGLVNFGTEVTVYTCDKTAVPLGLQFEVKRSFKKIWGNENKVLRAGRFTFCLFRTLLDASRQRVELVHFHFFHYTKMELLCVLLARLFGFKIVITAHDVESFAGKYSQKGARQIFAGVDRVIAHNRVSQKELLHQTGLTKETIAIIPHGNYLNAIPVSPSPAEARMRLNLELKSPVLLFFGQIKEVKGLDVLLQALPAVVSKFPTLKLLVAGKVWKDDFSKYDRIIQENDLRQHVELHIRYIPDQNVATFYRSADLVVLPYRKIYQSGVLLMAMSYGVPVLTSALEGMVEIVNDGVNGFVFEDGNVEKLSLRLVDLLSNPISAKKVALQGKSFVQEHHSWDHVGRETVALYASLLGK